MGFRDGGITRTGPIDVLIGGERLDFRTGRRSAGSPAYSTDRAESLIPFFSIWRITE